MRQPLVINAAQMWLAADTYHRQQHGQSPINPILLGFPEYFTTAYDPELHPTLFRAVAYSNWKGIDVSKILGSPDGNLGVFDLAAALEVGHALLNQQLFDFLTLQDVKGAHLEGYMAGTGQEADMYEPYRAEEIQLALAFMAQYRAEAASAPQLPPVGLYVLERNPLELLDKEILYKQLRIIILPLGMFISIIGPDGKSYLPFCWTPEGINTAIVWLSIKAVFALDILLMCLWRDAKVICEKSISTTRKQAALITGITKKSGSIKGLPRYVYLGTWGERTSPTTVESHLVRSFYRPQKADFIASDTVSENALAAGFPPPPIGFTFVRSYVRGGDVPETTSPARPIVWPGWQMAKMLMAQKRK